MSKKAEANGSDSGKQAAANKSSNVQKKEKSDSKPLSILQNLKANLELIIKAADTQSQGPVYRALRRTNRIRKFLPAESLQRAVEKYVSATNPCKSQLLLAISSSADSYKSTTAAEGLELEEDAEGGKKEQTPASHASKPEELSDLNIKESAAAIAAPAIEAYLSNIVISKLLEASRNDEAAALAEKVFSYFSAFNKRSLDIFASKTISFISLAHQHLGTLSSIRQFLLKAHRSACLQHNEIGQATIINLLLQSYLSDNLYDQADKLVQKVFFPENVSVNQFVRLQYYLGRIECVQLKYTDAYHHLNQAYRKAPQNTGGGFRTAVIKLSIIVQLLMGDIPERSLFSEPSTQNAVAPYLELTQAVRNGRLDVFNEVVQKFEDIFRRDGNFNVIQRLRQTVLKIGLRRINTSYSRISFADIAAKLKLESAIDAEYVCAKNIRDGVIKAQLDHKLGAMLSQDQADLYSTSEPQQSFHDRISFCLEMHDNAVKAMRYPPNAFRTSTGESAVIEDVDVDELVDDDSEED